MYMDASLVLSQVERRFQAGSVTMQDVSEHDLGRAVAVYKRAPEAQIKNLAEKLLEELKGLFW